MPGRHPRGPDHWGGDEDGGPGPAERAGDRDPGRRADYHTEQGLTPEDREAIGGGGNGGGSYAPTAEDAAARKRGGGDGPDDPGAWFGRPPNPPRPRRSPIGRQPKK